MWEGAILSLVLAAIILYVLVRYVFKRNHADGPTSGQRTRSETATTTARLPPETDDADQDEEYDQQLEDLRDLRDLRNRQDRQDQYEEAIPEPPPPVAARRPRPPPPPSTTVIEEELDDHLPSTPAAPQRVTMSPADRIRARLAGGGKL